MLNIPILLITFNRPNHVRKVLSEIKKQQPSKLYVFRDGARTGNSEDARKCAEVRKTVEELVDWPCDLQTHYSDVNLGCGAGPMNAIEWFFKNEESGIVMEDDCLPHPDMFAYCAELLEKYKDCGQVQFINTTLYDNRWQCEKSYGFSRYMVTGAWAAWRRAWQGFDLDLHSLNAKDFRKHCRKLLAECSEADWWYFKVLEIQRDSSKKSYWDYQMQILLFLHEAVTIHPKRNLVSNIGFDAEGTHTLDNADGRGNLTTYPIMPLEHPAIIEVDKEKDAHCFAKTRDVGKSRDSLQFIYKRMLYSDGFFHELLMFYKRVKGWKK